jgi:hypothetical protein
MLDLTFAEQIKIVIRRRGMTIKQLAETMERITGKPMSRQNLTQRLSRDNFQEQDMRLIAKILGCQFHLDVLECFNMDDDTIQFQLHKIEEKSERTKEKRKATIAAKTEHLTVGDALAISDKYDELDDEDQVDTQEDIESLLHSIEGKVNASDSKAKVADKKSGGLKDYLNKVRGKIATGSQDDATEEVPVQIEEEQVAATEPATYSSDAEIIESAKRHDKEDLKLGDVNPYTNHEYETNSVRTHKTKLGYVEVYDRSEHRWNSMTEWAFLGNEDHKKNVLGKSYRPPIYLD